MADAIACGSRTTNCVEHMAMSDPGLVPGGARSATERSPLLVTARQAAAMCGKSLRTWRSWDAAGRIPRPVRICRSTMWRVDELRRWVAAGCPRRDEWEVQ
jgi:predicted DNA-binding transcriptional regulator AlpA